MSVGVHCEAEPRWVIGSFEGLFGCQRVFLGVLNGLSGYLLAGCKANFYAHSYFLAVTHHCPLYQLDVKNTF